MTGIDAYETAWDTVSSNIWNVLGFNAFWLAGSFLSVVTLFLLTVVHSKNWAAFLFSSIALLLLIAPLWEAANIVRYGAVAGPSRGAHGLPVGKILVARLLFLVVVGIGYFALVLPGIYLHCRLCLYLPILVRIPTASPAQSLSRSWALTRSRFVVLYTLWIATVISKPAGLLPFGVGFLVERPVCGLAKDMMFWSCSNRPRDAPA